MTQNEPAPPQAMDFEAFMLQQQAAWAANGGGAAATVPQVWMGDWAGGNRQPTYTRLRRGGQRVQTVEGGMSSVDVDSAVLDFQSWDQQKLLEFQAELKKAGIEANNVFELEQQWANIVDAASRSWEAYDKKLIDKPLTPWEVLDNLTKMSAQSGGGTEPTTLTYTETEKLSDSDVRQLGETTFDATLGRAPSSGEMSGLPASSTSTRTVTTDAAGNQTSTTQRGANLGQLAVEYARSQDDYAEYQAATTYMGAFMDSLGAVV